MAARKPLAIDIFCGLGGWAEGFLAEDFDVIGFDIERHQYWVPDLPEADGHKGTKPVEKRGWTQGCAVSLGLEGSTAKARTKLLEYPAQLVLQDVLTLHGSQFKDAAVIVASPPCQFFSYTAMPWSRAKKLAAETRANPELLEQRLALFNACFRIQREASEAAGRHIPLVVENVVGAQAWVGPARWHHGSFYLWGDVPALMPLTLTRVLKQPGRNFHFPEKYGIPSPSFHGAAHETSVVRAEGVKVANDWFGSGEDCSPQRKASSKSHARKAASAQIAKIPFALAHWIARVYKPVMEKSA